MVKRSAPSTGIGCLFFVGAALPVTYKFHVRGDKSRGVQMVGSVSGDPERIREAYRATSLRLRLDDGAQHDLNIVAHAEGSPTAYFESRPLRTVRPRVTLHFGGGDSA